MTAIKLPHIDTFTDRYGARRYYFRMGRGAPRSKLPGKPGSKEFMLAYNLALGGGGAAPARPAKADDRSFHTLAAKFYLMPEFLSMKERTRHVYQLVVGRFLKEHGHRDASQMRRAHVKQIMGEMADRPGAANDLLKKLRALMKCAIDLEWRIDNPTTDIKTYAEGEFHTWTEEEIAQFERRWPLGTAERTAFALHLYTGQRRSDVCIMRPPNKDGLIAVKQIKTDAELLIPVHPLLREALGAWTRGLPDCVVVNAWGQPFTAAGYGNWFGDACRAAGLPAECSSHGLRKAAARRLAEAGCSEKEIQSITGHTTLKEVARYTKKANQQHLAKQALNRQVQAEKRPSQTRQPSQISAVSA